MDSDFEIKDGIYLVQSSHELDLHNDYDFQDLHYSTKDRTLLLHWQRGRGDWVPPDIPSSVSIEFREVSEFRFLPRDGKLPFTEDDCLNTFGYWTDEEWADGVFLPDPTRTPDPSWLTGIDFVSGAIIAVRAASVRARIET